MRKGMAIVLALLGAGALAGCYFLARPAAVNPNSLGSIYRAVGSKFPYDAAMLSFGVGFVVWGISLFFLKPPEEPGQPRSSWVLLIHGGVTAALSWMTWIASGAESVPASQVAAMLIATALCALMGALTFLFASMNDHSRSMPVLMIALFVMLASGGWIWFLALTHLSN